MSTHPSRAGSKWTWRKAKGCLSRGDNTGGIFASLCCSRDCSWCNKAELAKRIHFYLCQMSLSVWTLDFLVATAQRRKRHFFFSWTSFICTNWGKIKKREKVWRSEGRKSATNCEIRTRKQSDSLQKKISANTHCECWKQKIKTNCWPLSKRFLLNWFTKNVSALIHFFTSASIETL